MSNLIIGYVKGLVGAGLPNKQQSLHLLNGYYVPGSMQEFFIYNNSFNLHSNPLVRNYYCHGVYKFSIHK